MDNEGTGALEARKLGSYAPILIAAIMFAFVPTAMQTSCNGIFIPRIAADYGVNTSAVSVYMTLGNLTAALFAPFIGQALARFDIRVVTTCMVIGAAASFLSLSMSTSLAQVWVSGALETGFCTSFVGLVNPTLLTRWFKDHVGVVIGIAAAFTGFGGVVFIQVGQAIIDTMGYRAAYLAYTVLILTLCLPCTLFAIRSYPHERGLLPYETARGSRRRAERRVEGEEQRWSVDVRSALRNPAFYLLGLTSGVLGWCLLLNPHFPTYVGTLEEAGVAAAVSGAMLATIISASQGVGKLVLGAASDRSPLRAILLAGCLGVAAITMIRLGPTTVALPLGGVAFGFFFSTSAVLMPMLARSVFGTGESYSILLGRSQVITKLVTAPGAMAWPFIAENCGGWNTVFILGTIFVCAVVALSWLVSRFGARLEHLPLDAEGRVVR